jgi:NAD+ synthetase
MDIAIAQLNPTVGNLTANAAAIQQAADQLRDRSVAMLVTPELSLCGYPPRDLLVRPSFVAAMQAALEDLAAALPPEMAVLVGAAVPNPNATIGSKPLYNSAVLLRHGRVEAVFPKRLLPTYDVFDEDRYFQPGDRSATFTLQGHTVGVTVCEDLWNDEQFWGRKSYAVNPLEDLVSLGATLVVNLSASPYVAGKQRLREEMLQHSARRYGVSILYANQVGGNDDLIFDGTSLAIDRTGAIAGRAVGFETGLMLVHYDRPTDNLQRTNTLGTWEPSPPEPPALPIQVQAIAPLPPSLNAEIWLALVLGVRDYAHKCGFRRIVLGLSGGIDSSLVAAIAAAALGPEQVLGLLMPSPHSSDHSITDALALAQNLGIATHTLPIGDLMAQYDRTLSDLFVGTEPGITEENIQSRIRGNLLMAAANKFGHLLLSTGNKSEMAVGYCTLYGDMNGGLAAIADVPKTRVYALCHWLNGGQVGCPDWAKLATAAPPIPAHVLTKPPSAELRPDQADSDSLPAYDVLDDILDRLVCQAQSPAAIVAAGHDQALVDQVLKLLTRAEFKRRQAPPGLKVSDRAFGTGWRMPIACRWPTPIPEPVALPLPGLS